MYFTLVSDFDTLVAPHRQALLAFAIRSYNGDVDRAEDAVQETMIKAYLALPKLKIEHVNTWLHKILINTISTSRRPKKTGWSSGGRKWSRKTQSKEGVNVVEHQLSDEQAMLFISAEPDPVDVAIANELADRIKAIIQELPDEYRRVLLAAMNDAPYARMMKGLHMNMSTLHKKLAEARAILKNRLDAPVMQLVDISASKAGSCGFESLPEYQN